MTVHDERLPAKRLPARTIGVHVMLEHRCLALPEAVHIDRGAKVVHAQMRGHRRRFPDGSFSGFAVTEQDVNSLVTFVDAGVESHAESGRKALPE